MAPEIATQLKYLLIYAPVLDNGKGDKVMLEDGGQDIYSAGMLIWQSLGMV